MSNVVGLIPARLASTRLPGKSLADIEGMPMVVHTAKRAMQAKSLSAVYVCTDSEEIIDTCLKYGIQYIYKNGDFKNGTERICASTDAIDADYFIDIQGDEPLINPQHVDVVANTLISDDFKSDILLPVVRIPYYSSETIVKVQVSLSGRVMTLSRASLPFRYSSTQQFVYKHLSIIGFARKSLHHFGTLAPSPSEEVESIELLRALENDMIISTIVLQGDSFSVDIQDDLDRARLAMRNDKYFGTYK